MTRWVRFRQASGRIAGGALHDGGIAEHTDPATPTGATIAQDDVVLLAPCTPNKMIALWNNFHELGRKLGKKAPSHPLFLIKPASSIAGPGDTIRRPAGYAGKIAFEGELGIVIGRRCSNVTVAGASDFIAGYTCVNDVTAVDLMNEDENFVQWCRAKGFDTFGCIGPTVASTLDWANARVVTRLDGVERQNYPLSDMIFDPHELVSFLSQDLTLESGDVIACGTSVGVGSMKDGATVEIEIEGIGTLVNRVQA